MDTGDVRLLRRIQAPKVVNLKRLCPVILLTNMSDTLVNGSTGKVVGFGSDGPLVEFDQVTLEMKPTTFSGMSLINFTFYCATINDVFV